MSKRKAPAAKKDPPAKKAKTIDTPVMDQSDVSMFDVRAEASKEVLPVDKKAETPTEGLVALLALDPKEHTTMAQYQTCFAKIADGLMNDYVLEISNKAYRLAELEFYLNDENHADIFTHGDEQQESHAKWYFHRMGSGYKGGSYKGLDITFSTRGYGGILIRAIKSLDDGTYVEGPSKVVDTIIGSTAVADYVEKKDFDWSVCKQSCLCLRPKKDKELEKRDLEVSARFGLVLRNDAQAVFVLKPYRFMSFPSEVRKGRQHLVLDLHHRGKTASEITKITGVTAAAGAKWTSVYETAKNGKQTPQSFYAQKLAVKEFSEFYGVLKPVSDNHKLPVSEQPEKEKEKKSKK